MAKLVPYVIVLILVVFARITISDDSSSSYYSWNYGGVSSNDVDASSRGYESPTSEENQYYTPPSSSEGDVDSTNTYYESQYSYPPNAGADNSPSLDDVTYASPPDMSSAPSSLETVPNNSDETYKDQLSSPSSYDDSSTPQSDSSSSSSSYDDSSTPQSDSSSSSSSYDDSSTPQSDSSSSSSYDDWSTPQSDSSSSSSSSYDDSSTPQSDSSSSSSYDDSASSSSSDDLSSSSSSSPTTTDESQSGTEELYNSVEEVGSGVVGTEMETEHKGSKAGLVFGVLIGVCAVGAAGFIYIKRKRESYPNTNKYISLTRWDRI